MLQVQSFDQTFEKMNKALQVSCQKGLPVRVVRSYKVALPPAAKIQPDQYLIARPGIKLRQVLLMHPSCNVEAHMGLRVAIRLGVVPQEKRSAYAPSEEQPVRYDGIYRIAACYRKPGNQGKLVCRYLFRRCDNEPAPWASDGTCPRP